MKVVVIANKEGREIVKTWMEKHLPEAHVTYKAGKAGTVKIICSHHAEAVFTSLKKLLSENKINLSVWVEKR